MGFSTLIDIIGSFILGGLLLLILLRMNSSSVQSNYEFSCNTTVQTSINSIVSILENDLRKIGYCSDPQKLPDPALAIVKADSNQIWFVSDIVILPAYPYSDGVVDTIKYYLGPASELSFTTNPNDRYLYRVINSNTARISSIGLTVFKLTYFDTHGNKIKVMPASPPLGIAAIQIDAGAENPSPYGQYYSLEKRALVTYLQFPQDPDRCLPARL